MKRKHLTFLIIFVVFLLIFLHLAVFPFNALKRFRNQSWSTRFTDCDNRLVQIVPIPDAQGLRREFTAIQDIPTEVQNAFIEAEDKRFYSHHGIDITAIFRALKQNANAGRRVSGASTITMQLARLIVPAPKRTIFAKIREAWNALRLECRMSKTQILELYLNSIPFGYQTEGITSACRTFYGLDAINPLPLLTSEQIIELAAIPRRPALYAKKVSNFTYPFFMPHYINYLTELILTTEKKLPAQYKLTASLELQLYAEDILSTSIKQFEGNRLSNGAVLLIENKTGNVLTWIGSGNFFNDDNGGQINGVLVPNQPGSSMKPFLYALALESGFTPASVLPDIPLEFGFEQIYIPRNFNNRYNGPVRLRTSLASSLNVPAVWLLNKVGMSAYLKRLLQLGFTSLEDGLDNKEFPSSHIAGLGIAIGNAEITLKELTTAFSVFANDGKLISLNHNSNSKTITSTNQVFEQDTARLICSILSDAPSRATGFGFSKVFATPFPSIFKTGTANQFQNITALGSTPLYTVGVWMGNFSGNTVIGKTGSSIPALIAKNILCRVQGTEAPVFKKPGSLAKTKICTLSGMPCSENCPDTIYEYLPKNTAKNDVCTWHTKDSIIYPAEYQTWFNLKDREGSIDYSSSSLKIVYPRNNSHFIFDPKISAEAQMLTFEVIGGESNILFVYYDNQPAVQVNRPFNFTVPIEKGNHKVEVKCIANSFTETASIEFVVE